MLFILFLGASIYIREDIYKRKIISKLNAQIATKYDMPSNIERISKNGSRDIEVEEIKYNIKLVYEINDECSLCLANLVKIYEFYKRLCSYENILLCIVCDDNNYSYIRYYIDKVLEKYDILILKKENTNKQSNLYLLDRQNNIIISGDIIRYPFLAKEYIKKIKDIAEPKNSNHL